MMVFITTIFLGAIMPGFITWCLKKDLINIPPEEIDRLVEKDEEEESDLTREKEDKKKLKGFKRLDELFLKPCLIHDYENRKKEIK